MSGIGRRIVSRGLRGLNVGTVTHTTITGLTEATRYFVEVRAENSVGESLWSLLGSGAETSATPTHDVSFVVTSGEPVALVAAERAEVVTRDTALTTTSGEHTASIAAGVFNIDIVALGVLSTGVTTQDGEITGREDQFSILNDDHFRATDWYTFTLPGMTTHLIIQSIGGLDMVGWLYSGTITSISDLADLGSRIGYDDDGGAVNNFKISRSNQLGGDYTVAVQRLQLGSATYRLSVTVEIATVPARPSRPITVPASSSSVSAIWSAPNTGGQAITDYDVRYRPGRSGDWTNWPFSGVDTGTTITGLLSDTLYEVQVRAENVVGDGAWSLSGSATTAMEAALVVTSGEPVASIAAERSAVTTHDAALTVSSGEPSVEVAAERSAVVAGDADLTATSGHPVVSLVAERVALAARDVSLAVTSGEPAASIAVERSVVTDHNAALIVSSGEPVVSIVAERSQVVVGDAELTATSGHPVVSLVPDRVVPTARNVSLAVASGEPIVLIVVERAQIVAGDTEITFFSGHPVVSLSVERVVVPFHNISFAVISGRPRCLIGAIRVNYGETELMRLTDLRDRIRKSISDMEEDNSMGASFGSADRTINHLPLETLKESEAVYTIKINELIMKKKGLSYIFGQTIQFI